MAYFLFIDESGQDRKASPYEVLAGVSIQDSELWNLIQRIHDLEKDIFGMRISEGNLELKAKKLLKRKTFRLASQNSEIATDQRRDLVRSCLHKGLAKDPLITKKRTYRPWASQDSVCIRPVGAVRPA